MNLTDSLSLACTCVHQLAPLAVGVPQEEVGRLVGYGRQEVAVLVPPKAAAHPRQPDLVDNLRVPVVDGHQLVISRGGQEPSAGPLPAEEHPSCAMGRFQAEQLLAGRRHLGLFEPAAVLVADPGPLLHQVEMLKRLFRGIHVKGSGGKHRGQVDKGRWSA